MMSQFGRVWKSLEEFGRVWKSLEEIGRLGFSQGGEEQDQVRDGEEQGLVRVGEEQGLVREGEEQGLVREEKSMVWLGRKRVGLVGLMVALIVLWFVE